MALQAAALYATVSVAGASQSVRQLGAVSGAVDSTQKKLSLLGRQSQGIGKGVGQMVGGVTTIVKRVGEAALLLAAGGAAVAASFEDSFAGVKKTVEGTPQQLDALYESLKNLSTRIPVSFGDLAGIATEAGALDVAAADVDNFTEAVARTTAATVGLDKAAAAEAFGKLGTIFKLRDKGYEQLGSSLVELGRNAASTEVDIISVTQRFAAAGTAAGLSAADVLGWSSAIASLGPEAEAAGSAMSRVFNKMTQNIALAVTDASKAGKAVVDPLKVEAAQLKVEGAHIRLTKAIKDHGRASLEARAATNALHQAESTLAIAQAGKVPAGGDVVAANAKARLAEFAKVTQMPVKDFTKLYKDDAGGALELFLEKLGKMDKFAASASLKRAGIINVRDVNAILLLAQHTDILRKNLVTSNTAWKENTALLSVSEKRFDTFKNHLTELKNTVMVAADAFGEGLLPAIGRVAAKAKTSLLGHMADFKQMGLEVGEFIDGIPWGKVEGGLHRAADAARTVLDIVKQIAGTYPEATTATVGLIAIDKLSGGMLGKGAGNIVGGVANLALNHFFERGSSPANPVWVAGLGGGGGGLPGVGGAAGGAFLTSGILGPAALIGAGVASTIIGSQVVRAAVDKAIATSDISALTAQAEAARKHGVSDENNAALQALQAIVHNTASRPNPANAASDAEDAQERAIMARRSGFTSNPTRMELRQKIRLDKEALDHATGKNAKAIGADLHSLQNRLQNRIDKGNREAIVNAAATGVSIAASATKVANAVDNGWTGVAAAIDRQTRSEPFVDNGWTGAVPREPVQINPSAVIVTVAGRAIANAQVLWDRSRRTRLG